METNITRRRLVQGAGAIGVASVVGSTAVSAQEDGETADDQLAAVRVAHASPDTPSVDVRLSPSSGGETTGTENETTAPTGENETVAEGGENETVATDGGNETAPGAEEDGEAEEMTIEGVGFRDVSDYTEIQGGSYQVQIVVTEGGGFLDDLFGGGDQEEVVVLDDELEIEAGTTYTVVAYGEIAQAEDPERVAEFQLPGEEDAEDDAGLDTAGEDDSPAAAGDGEDDNATAVGEDDNASAIGEEDDEAAVGEDGNETAMGEDAETDLGEDATGEEPDTSFQVQVLEDDLADPGEDQTRLRIFHAVPDAPAVSVSATSDGAETPAEAGDNETMADGNETAVGEDENGSAIGTDDDEAAAVGDDENATDVGGENATESPAETGGDLGAGAEDLSIDELAYGESETLEFAAGDYTLEFRSAEGAPADAGTEMGEDTPVGGAEENATAVGEDENATGLGEEADEGLGEDENATVGGDEETDVGGEGNTTAVGEGAADGGDTVQEREISPNGGVVYSGFALGYFDPEAAAVDGEAGGETGADENATADGGNVTDVTETGDNETAAGNETAADEGEDVAEDPEGEEFELVTVSDSEDGERAEGGTGGDGLF